MPTVRRPVRPAIVTTRKINDIRIALALRHSMADIQHLYTPRSSLVRRYWGAAVFAVTIVFYALKLAWSARKGLTWHLR